MSLGDISCDSVLVADDVTLLRLCGMRGMMSTMERHSNKWRFEFYPTKTTVVVFGKSTQMYNLRKNSGRWLLNNFAIEEKFSWNHVGI